MLREVAKGLSKYQPDVIVSVHPLMQHIPLRVLRARGLLDKIPFTTVITDLSTCHPTWYAFHPILKLRVHSIPGLADVSFRMHSYRRTGYSVAYEHSFWSTIAFLLDLFGMAGSTG